MTELTLRRKVKPHTKHNKNSRASRGPKSASRRKQENLARVFRIQNNKPRTPQKQPKTSQGFCESKTTDLARIFRVRNNQPRTHQNQRKTSHAFCESKTTDLARILRVQNRQPRTHQNQPRNLARIYRVLNELPHIQNRGVKSYVAWAGITFLCSNDTFMLE